VAGEVLAMYFRPLSKRAIAFTNVFQHFAEDTSVRLKSTVLQVIHHSIHRTEEGYPRMRDTIQTIDPGRLGELRDSISPYLYYGSFNLTKTRTLSHELAWKWTEATGKFIGCQFWSVKAGAFFVGEMKKRYRKTGRFNQAWNLAKELSSTKYGSYALNHEHVFPIAKLREILLTPSPYREFTNSLAALEKFFDRAIVGCVLLKQEHEEIHSKPGNWDNCWLRYKGSSIKLVPNPGWSRAQQQSIKKANLL